MKTIQQKKSCVLSIAFLFLVVVHSGYSQQTLILQPNATCGKDAILHGLASEVNVNYGSNPQFAALAWTFIGDPGTIRSVVEFDLSSIPPGSTITSASLTLFAWYSSGGLGQHNPLSGSNVAWVQRVTSPWNESTVTWNTQPATTTTNQVSVPASVSPSQNYTITVTSLVQDMINNPLNSHGFMIRQQLEQYYRSLNFCSSDEPNAALHPKLEVHYIPSSQAPYYSSFLGHDTTNCFSTTPNFQLNASGLNGTYQWQDGSTQPTFTAHNVGTYWVQVTTCNNVYRDTIVVTDSCGTTGPQPGTIVLQPDSLCGKDATVNSLSSAANLNRGNSPYFSAAAWTFSGDPGTVRSMVEFDLSGIPPGSTITSASLTLYAWYSSSGLGQHSPLSGSNAGWVQRITSPWSESTVTWNTQPTTTTINQASMPASVSPTQNYTVTVTSMVQDMINNPANSHGFMIRQQLEQYYRSLNFCSSDEPNAALHPKLEIHFISSGPVPVYSGFLGADTTNCFSSSPNIQLNASALNGTYQWQDGSTQPTYTAHSAGTYWVQVTTCSNTYRDTIVVTDSCSTTGPGGVLILQPDADCGKDALLHGLASEANTNWGSVNQFCAASWTFNGTPGDLRSAIEFDLSNIPPGSTITSASLTLYAWYSSGGLGQHDPLSGSNEAWVQRITSAWNESTVTWNTQPATSTVNQVSMPMSVSSTQDYTITVTDLVQDMINDPANSHGFMLRLKTESYYRRLNFCSSDEANPSLHPRLEIHFTAPASSQYLHPLGSDTSICFPGSLLLNANHSNSTYVWQDGSTLATYTVQGPGTYWVDVINCGGSYRDTLVVMDPCTDPVNQDTLIAFELPNIITPTGDGNNDLFVPVKSEGITAVHTDIFNLWGQQLYSSDNLDIMWNGKTEGKDVPDGVYFYLVRYTDRKGNTTELPGYLTLIR